MLYKKWKKTGDEISILGFGAMRLPVVDKTDGNIDEEKAISMIRKAIDQGVNYLDTAWPYHGGNSERICGKVMKDGYREKVYIATKMPSWEIETFEDMERILDEQLKKLEVECIDYYLLHTLTEEYWEKYQKLDYKSFLLKAKREGKIRNLGFSYHDNKDLFKEIVDDFDWDFVQIQLNYLDEEYQAGMEGARYAYAKDMDVIVMEPLRGGLLAADPPEGIKEILSSAQIERTPADWALRYLWDKPEISMILSGMTTEEQMEENLLTASSSPENHLKKEDRDTVQSMKEFYHSKIRVNCTNCRYCLPCPSGVYIPELFWAYNHDAIFGDYDKARFWVTGFIKEEQRASQCIECGICEEHCPQQIPIREHLKKIVDLYENAAE